MTERTLGREQAIYRVTWIGFAVNLVLSAGKLAAGIWGHSAAMVADAIHSVSDFATDLVVLLFVRVSAKPRDDDHDYGHGKYETLATLIIGAALAGVGIKLLWSGGTAIRDFTRGLLPTQPGVVALWAAVVSIVAKEALYRYTARVGRRVNSPSVVANAWHHRSDALSSVGTLVGIGCDIAVLDHHLDIVADTTAVAFDQLGNSIPVARKVAIKQFLITYYLNVHTLLLI